MNLPYNIIIRKDPYEGYFAKVEELEGCMTQGETYFFIKMSSVLIVYPLDNGFESIPCYIIFKIDKIVVAYSSKYTASQTGIW